MGVTRKNPKKITKTSMKTQRTCENGLPGHSQNVRAKLDRKEKTKITKPRFQQASTPVSRSQGASESTGSWTMKITQPRFQRNKILREKLATHCKHNGLKNYTNKKKLVSNYIIVRRQEHTPPTKRPRMQNLNPLKPVYQYK